MEGRERRDDRGPGCDEQGASRQLGSADATKFDGIEEVAVFGVKLPKHDGRAGCAALEAKVLEKLDLDKLAKHLGDSLPKYAQPLFLRGVKEIETTSTNKIVTTNLKKQGVDPEETGEDKVMVLDKGKYRPFEKSDWEKIESGGASLRAFGGR